MPEAVREFLKTANANPSGVQTFFCEVGMSIERKRLAASLVTQLFHTQTLINGWKKQFGLPVAAESAESKTAFANPHNYLRDLAKDVHGLLTHASQFVATAV